MNAIFRWIDYWNRKIKRLGIIEVKMAQIASMGFALIIVKIFPQIMTLDIRWFVALVVICAVPVNYALWFKNESSQGAPADARKPRG